MEVLDDLVRWGKVRYTGASNFSAWQLTWSSALAGTRGWSQFVSLQPHYHMFERDLEKEIIPACQYFNLGILPYFPLAGGFLTGKYKQGEPPPAGWRGESSKYVQGYMTSENFTRLQHLQAFAGERDHNLNDLAHAWLLAQPQVSWVISGATRVEHVVANTSTGDWMLTEDEAAQVRKILENSVLD